MNILQISKLISKYYVNYDLRKVNNDCNIENVIYFMSKVKSSIQKDKIKKVIKIFEKYLKYLPMYKKEYFIFYKFKVCFPYINVNKIDFKSDELNGFYNCTFKLLKKINKIFDIELEELWEWQRWDGNFGLFKYY